MVNTENLSPSGEDLTFTLNVTSSLHVNITACFTVYCLSYVIPFENIFRHQKLSSPAAHFNLLQRTDSFFRI